MIINFEQALILKHLVENEIKDYEKLNEDYCDILNVLLHKIDNLINDDIFTLTKGSDNNDL